MTKKKNVGPVNYDVTDAELIDQMYDRDLYPPYNVDGKLVKEVAIRRLQEWEATHREMDSRYCLVMFPRTGNANAGNSVFVSINNKNWQIPFGEKVVLPEYVLRESIDRAVVVKFVPVSKQDQDTTWQTVEEQVYPYNFYGYVDKEGNPVD